MGENTTLESLGGAGASALPRTVSETELAAYCGADGPESSSRSVIGPGMLFSNTNAPFHSFQRIGQNYSIYIFCDVMNMHMKDLQNNNSRIYLLVGKAKMCFYK